MVNIDLIRSTDEDLFVFFNSKISNFQKDLYIYSLNHYREEKTVVEFLELFDSGEVFIDNYQNLFRPINLDQLMFLFRNRHDIDVYEKSKIDNTYICPFNLDGSARFSLDYFNDNSFYIEIEKWDKYFT